LFSLLAFPLIGFLSALVPRELNVSTWPTVPRSASVVSALEQGRCQEGDDISQNPADPFGSDGLDILPVGSPHSKKLGIMQKVILSKLLNDSSSSLLLAGPNDAQAFSPLDF